MWFAWEIPMQIGPRSRELSVTWLRTFIRHMLFVRKINSTFITQVVNTQNVNIFHVFGWWQNYHRAIPHTEFARDFDKIENIMYIMEDMVAYYYTTTLAMSIVLYRHIVQRLMEWSYERSRWKYRSAIKEVRIQSAQITIPINHDTMVLASLPSLLSSSSRSSPSSL